MAMEKYGFTPRFPEPVLQEVNALTDKVPLFDKGMTKDLRSLLWSSIDNIDSMDLDHWNTASVGRAARSGS